MDREGGDRDQGECQPGAPAHFATITRTTLAGAIYIGLGQDWCVVEAETSALKRTVCD